ncbi:MAG: sugar-binding protein [Tepidisphaeraceae bacterium]
MLRNFAVLFALLVMLGWFGGPYLTNATEKSHAIAFQSPADDVLSASGDFRQVRGHEGFWRLVEDQSGVWWFYSPDDQKEFLNTVTTVQPVQFGEMPADPHYVSRDAFGGANGMARWAMLTLQRVRDIGFKGLGAWCNPAFHDLNVPMSQDLNLWTWVKDDSKRFYSPDWASMAEQAAKAQTLPLVNNRNLTGYFIDNELDWGDGFSGPSAYFDHLSANDPNRLQVISVIRSLWHSVGDFNAAWGTKLSDWKQIDQLPALPRDAESAYTLLGGVWLEHLAEDYFRTTTTLIRKYDPNHLVLGVRFKGYAPEEVVTASRDYTDAQSLNYYVGDAQLDSRMFSMMYQRSGQPIVISEYSFHSLDGRSGDRDTVGFNAQVPDQQARADGYRLMTTRLARVPYVVGADWFQWSDEPPSGRSPDGEDVNFGIVDIHDREYQQLADAVHDTTPLLDSLHSASSVDSQTDVWRESYAAMPLMHVPYLDKAPKLDGDLSDWTSQSELVGIHRDQTVGLDRRPVNTPNVYLGWTAKGLYMAMQVFDNQLTTAPATGWWWTRDNIEMWISTRPPSPDQETYDTDCHQFFFDPVLSPAIPNGVVGQWHREGDALTDNLIPAPGVNQVLKVLPDRYIVEMFIPAKALHGFDAAHQRALGFNIHIRDFQSAADFFWSSPKATQTQLRPDTWGLLYLDPPLNAGTVADLNLK